MGIEYLFDLLTSGRAMSVCASAIGRFGADRQTDKFLEEMDELSQAILKHRHGEDALGHVAEETADVLITLTQQFLIRDESFLGMVAAWIREKTEGLDGKLTRGELDRD